MIRRKRGSEDLYVLKDYLDPSAIINPRLGSVPAK